MQHKQNHGNLAHPASTRILCHLLPCSRNYHHLLSIISKIDFHTFPWTCTWLDRWAAMPIVAAGRWWLTLVSPMTSDDDVGFQSNQAREPCHLFILFDRERCEHWANLHHRSSWFAVLMRPPDETKFSQTQAHDFGISARWDKVLANTGARFWDFPFSAPFLHPWFIQTSCKKTERSSGAC